MSKMTSRKVETRTTVALTAATYHHTSSPDSLLRSKWNLASRESLAEFTLRFGFLTPNPPGQAKAPVPGLPEVR